MNSNVYDTKNLPMVMRLFGKYKVLEYDELTARYDLRSKLALESLLTTGLIGDQFKIVSFDDALQLMDKKSLCYTHAIRKEVVAKKRALGLDFGEFVMTKTVTSKKLDHQFVNSEIVTADEIVGFGMKEEDHYVSTLCMTGHKVQGLTLREPYTVFVEPAHDTLNTIYVKLSRPAGSIDKITLALPRGWTKEQLLAHVWKFDDLFVTRGDPGEKGVGWIYLMTENSTKRFYVGTNTKK